VAFPLREKTKLDEEEIRERVLHELDQVGLAGAENKYPAELSGGMLKRTAFARALVTKPEIILFDEPTTGLDPVIAHTILDLVKSIHQQLGFTAIIVSHELSRVFQIAHKVAMLHEGVILTTGTPEEILSSDDPVVRQFVSGSLEGPIKLY
jgi:phospholipid/cholesterol/gamma-HCH transport system ATP-binding protein